MSLIRSSLIAVLSFLMPSLAMSAVASFDGLVQVRTGHSLYVRYAAPQEGQPTAILLNGLTNRVSDWNSFSNQLEKRGVGVLRFDFMGQGQTLIASSGVSAELTVAAQVEDLRGLIEKLDIPTPIHLVGFSYGGGIAQAFAAKYAAQINTLTLMSPFTAPIESQDAYLRWQVSMHRFYFPLDSRSQEEIYDHYLRAFIFMTYPSADPRLLENQYRLEGVFRLVQGIRRFKSSDVMGRFPKAKLHLMIGTFDELIPARMLEDYWTALPTDVKASRLSIVGAQHRLPENQPVLTAGWVFRIISGDKELSGGRSFTVNPWFPASQTERQAPN